MDYVKGLPLFELRDARRHADAFRAEELMQDFSIAGAPWMQREDAERIHRDLAAGAASIYQPAGPAGAAARTSAAAPVVDRSPGGEDQAVAWQRLRAITNGSLSGNKGRPHE